MAAVGDDRLTQPPDARRPEGHAGVTRCMERRNFWVFSASFALTYFGAPIFFVGVVQAALCNRLGASAALANLPAAGYDIGYVAPFLVACLIPTRLEKATLVIACYFETICTAVCCLALIVSVSNATRITMVVGQGTLMGFADSIATVYKYQCLGRGTTEKGRARVLKVAFTLGPLCAVAGSLTAQWILNSGSALLQYPHNFALLYAIASVCMLGVAVLSGKYQMASLQEEPRQPFRQVFRDAFRAFTGNRELRILWISCFFWSCTWNSIPSLSLYTRDLLGRSPEALSGLILAVRFGCKSFMGFILGILAIRYGIRAPVLAATLLSALGILWVWGTPSSLFLIAFGLMGAGELGTPYFNNYVIALSNPVDGAKNLALINFASAAAFFSPVVYGSLIDHFGFSVNFMAGVAAGLLAFATLFKLPPGTPRMQTLVASPKP